VSHWRLVSEGAVRGAQSTLEPIALVTSNLAAGALF
jgi:hypothetical protein